jgi:hypothetical protein
MTRIALTQGYYQARSYIANAQRCLNLYPEGNTEDAPAPMTNYLTPGLTTLVDSLTNAQVRCLYTASNNQGYAIIGSGVYTVSSSFALAKIGTLPTSTGNVYMQDNGIDIVIIDRTTAGYQIALTSGSTATGTGTISGSILTIESTPAPTGSFVVGLTLNGPGIQTCTITALGSGTGGPGTYSISVSQNVTHPTQITGTSNANFVSQIEDPTGSFVGSINVAYLDSFFIFSQPNTNVMYCSLSNSLTFDPLYLVGRTGAPDWIAGLAVCQRILWVIGQKTTELWYDAGQADFPFGQIQGSFFQVGCAAASSIAVADVFVWWLGQNAQGQGVVYQGSGGQVLRISTHAIEAVIQGFIEITDAIGMTYQQQGHTFYVLTFPAASRTFVYDAVTQLWHERAWIDNNGFEHRHRANCIANMYGKVVCGDWANGKIYELDLGAYTDDGQPIKRVRGFPHLMTSYDPKSGLSHLEGKRIRYDQFMADIEVGNLQTIGVANGTPKICQFTVVA